MTNDVISTEPLGPSGVKARIREIENRMAQLSGAEPGLDFASNLQGAIGDLQGPIGSQTPLSPFGHEISLESGPNAEMRSMIERAATANNVDPALLDALVSQESGYSTTARSRVGAMGLTQLMPETARALGVSNAFDPAANLDAGARYLRQQLDRFGGNIELALAAFNAGPAAVEKVGAVPPYRETQNYVKSIMGRYAATKGGKLGQ